MTSDRRHPAEAEFIRFLERKDQSSAYVKRCAEWIKIEYPGSVRTVLPKMRQIYKDKQRDGQ